MGWDYSHVDSPVRRAAECRRMVSENYEVVKDALVGSTWYAALRDKRTGEVHAAVWLTSIKSRDYCNFGIKAMSESAGPFAYGCPASILDLLTPTTSNDAIEWRARCRVENENGRRKKSVLDSAPFEARIRVTLTDGTTRTVIKKKPGYQFKTYWLLVENDYHYVAKRSVKDAELLDT